MCALAVRAPFDRAVLPNFAASGGTVDVVLGTDDRHPEQAGERRDHRRRAADDGGGRCAGCNRCAGPGNTGRDCDVRGWAWPCRADHARPDLSTEASFRRALLEARSVAFSRGGASGIYFAGLMERMGIAEAVRAKATIIPAGFAAEKLVSGEADLAVQQISELMVVDGVDIVGPFPDAVQTTMRFSAAAVVGSPARPAPSWRSWRRWGATPPRLRSAIGGLDPAA